jgi:hypothetical protein
MSQSWERMVGDVTVAGTFCGGPVQGLYIEIDTCYNCEFYWHVNSEGKEAVP